MPVSIEYDRIFDSDSLMTEISKGETKGTRLVDRIKNIVKMRKQKLGKIIVKHCDPIDLNTYVMDFYDLRG